MGPGSSRVQDQVPVLLGEADCEQVNRHITTTESGKYYEVKPSDGIVSAGGCYQP